MNAWSISDPWKYPQTRRRSFLVDSATAASVFIGAGAVVPSPVSASSPIYQPDPHSLTGKVILITGSSSGLGLESAKRLASADATVILTTRSSEKGEKALAQVQEYLAGKSIHNPNVYHISLDLDDLKHSVKTFPRRYEDLMGTRCIDVLMNNAGVAFIPSKEVTMDGLERIFQSNNVGPFVLTALLFPYLNRGGSRIINVSSVAHSFATISSTGFSGLDLDNLNSELDYDGFSSYCRSKLENILFTQELQRRGDAAGLDWLTVVSLHPGVIGTDIWRYNSAITRDKSRTSGNPLQSLVSDLVYSKMKTIEEGCNTQVFLAAGGDCWENSQRTVL